MDRARRLGSLWPWLPAFRAVAETEHLPSASDALHVTPSALSRTIRLLEEELEQRLFERRGRRLTLAPAGRVMLRAVRDAMRLVDEGIEAAATLENTRSVVITCPGPLIPLLVLPALEGLNTIAPVLRTHPGPTEVVRGLLAGKIDVALLDDPVPSEELRIQEVLRLEHGVFAAAQSPFGGRAMSSLPFAAPLPIDGQRPDAWPPDRPRHVALEVTTMQAAIDAVASGSHVAVLPKLVAQERKLESLTAEGIPSTTLYLLQRQRLPGVETPADRVADAVEASAKRL
ncbi:MAG: LysR family transcriptional regulator [Myxococcota bacterium]